MLFEKSRILIDFIEKIYIYTEKAKIYSIFIII